MLSQVKQKNLDNQYRSDFCLEPNEPSLYRIDCMYVLFNYDFQVNPCF